MKKLTVSVLLLALVLTCFTACSGLDLTGNKEIKYKISDDHAVVSELPNITAVTEVEIADEYEGLPVTEIADFAGCNLEFITKITIGKNVETVGEWAFTNNQKLKEFVVDEANENICSKDGVLYSKDMKTIMFYPCGASKEYTIPDSVETIRSKAFYKCESLEKLTLPASLESIGEKAFFRCSALTNVELPDGVKFIAKDAFGYCTTMTEITIPSAIEEIGEYAFYNCTELHNVKVNAKESDVVLGKEWQPTNNGLKIDELKIEWN